MSIFSVFTSEFGACVNGEQTRTVQKCDSTTNYAWIETKETAACQLECLDVQPQNSEWNSNIMKDYECLSQKDTQTRYKCDKTTGKWVTYTYETSCCQKPQDWSVCVNSIQYRNSFIRAFYYEETCIVNQQQKYCENSIEPNMGGWSYTTEIGTLHIQGQDYYWFVKCPEQYSYCLLGGYCDKSWCFENDFCNIYWGYGYYFRDFGCYDIGKGYILGNPSMFKVYSDRYYKICSQGQCCEADCDSRAGIGSINTYKYWKGVK